MPGMCLYPDYLVTFTYNPGVFGTQCSVKIPLCGLTMQKKMKEMHLRCVGMCKQILFQRVLDRGGNCGH
jgi:hypothetical protein